MDFEFDQRPAEIFTEFGKASAEVETVFDFAADGNVEFTGFFILTVAGKFFGEKFFQLFIHASRRTVGKCEIEPRVPLGFGLGAEVGMGGGDFVAQGTDGVFHRAGGENAIVAGPDAVRVSPSDIRRCIEKILLEAGRGGFDRVEDGAIGAVAAFLAQEFNKLVESALGARCGDKETVKRETAVFLQSGFVEQTKLAAESEFKRKGAHDASEKPVHRTHGKTRKCGSELPEPGAALVGCKIRVPELGAQPVELGGVAGGAGETSEKFLQKFRGGFAGEGESKDAIRGFAAGEQFQTAGDEAVGFAAAGIGHDEEDAGEIFHERPSKWVMVAWSKICRGSSPPNHSAKLSYFTFSAGGQKLPQATRSAIAVAQTSAWLCVASSRPSSAIWVSSGSPGKRRYPVAIPFLA